MGNLEIVNLNLVKCQGLLLTKCVTVSENPSDVAVAKLCETAKNQEKKMFWSKLDFSANDIHYLAKKSAF